MIYYYYYSKYSYITLENNIYEGKHNKSINLFFQNCLIISIGSNKTVLI